jgi:hypothetical protein
MKKIIYSMLVLVCTIFLQSCLHDNEDYFDQSAAERLSNAVSSDKSLLESATNGWHLEYYAGKDYQYGGYNYLVKFNKGKATVACELQSDTIITSDYDVVDDQGPVLTFNTYNAFMHYFAEPEQDNVEGLQGDYEFLIMKVTTDTLYLQGKKWGNQMILTRIPENTAWQSYMQSLTSMNDSMKYCTFKLCVNNDSVADVKINYPDDKDITITDASGEKESTFITTTTGLKLSEPITVSGQKIESLNFDVKKQQFSIEGNNVVSIQYYIPEGYHTLKYYEGSYYFTDYYGEHYTVKLTANKDAKGLTVTGGTFPYPMVFNYSKITGKISLINQELGEHKLSDGNTYYIYLLVWSLASNGSLNYKSGAGMIGTADEDGNIWFKDNGVWSSGVDSFIFGAYANSSFNFDIFGQDGMFPYFTELKRIN